MGSRDKTSLGSVCAPLSQLPCHRVSHRVLPDAPVVSPFADRWAQRLTDDCGALHDDDETSATSRPALRNAADRCTEETKNLRRGTTVSSLLMRRVLCVVVHTGGVAAAAWRRRRGGGGVGHLEPRMIATQWRCWRCLPKPGGVRTQPVSCVARTSLTRDTVMVYGVW